MENTGKHTLLACALPIPADPYNRMMGVLISIDGRRCLSQLIPSVDHGRKLLLDPLMRDHFKAYGFDLSKEIVQWVEKPYSDRGYLDACITFQGINQTAADKQRRDHALQQAAPRN
jgi:hypothetical protein